MHDALTSAAVVWRNAPLRRLQTAALLSATCGSAYGTALFVWAFGSGGPSSVGVAGLVVLGPAALLAPFAAVVGDRGRRDRTLAALAGLRAVLLAATGAAMAITAPTPLVFALAAFANVPTRVYYPVQAALLPTLTHGEHDLTLGPGGVGILNASIGGGGILGGGVALAFAARSRPGSDLRLATIAWGMPLALIADVPGRPAALALLVVVGAGNVVVDTTSYTLIQRAAADAVRARVFGALEGIAVTAGAIGTLGGGILVSDLGARTTLLALGLALPALAFVLWRPIGRLDNAAAVASPAA